MTPLMGAAMYNEWDAAYRLLDAGARPLDVNWFNGSALDLARSEFMYRLILAAAFPGPDGENRAVDELLARLGLDESESAVLVGERASIPHRFTAGSGFYCVRWRAQPFPRWPGTKLTASYCLPQFLKAACRCFSNQV